MRKSSILAIFLVLGLGACGGEEQPPGDGGGGGSSGDGGSTGTEGGGGASGMGGAPVNPLGEKITLTLETFDVQPGTERQVCKIVNLPAGADADIVRFYSNMTGTSHHFNAYKVLEGDVTAPVSEAESTVHDCSPGQDQLNGTAAYIFGSASPERTVDMPEGVAFHLLDQQRIVLEQHVINATGSVIQGGVTFDIYRAGAEADIQHWADIMWMAEWGIVLPAAQETSITQHCSVPYDVEVFGLMSHTHALGTHFSIDSWAADGSTDHVYDSSDWSHPLYMQLGPPMSVAAGDGFEWTCTWSNTTGHMVQAGQNSTDEMCMMFAYAYPKDSKSAEPYQCNKF